MTSGPTKLSQPAEMTAAMMAARWPRIAQVRSSLVVTGRRLALTGWGSVVSCPHRLVRGPPALLGSALIRTLIRP